MSARRRLHRATAVVVALFALVHVANHLLSLASVAAHVQVMELLRTVYRQPLVEAALLLCVVSQCATGLSVAVAGRRTRAGTVAKLQAASGVMLALFLLVHVSAVLMGRGVLDLDTNFHFAAAGLQQAPYAYFFAPYYFLSVVALFAHLGCALSWHAGPGRGARAATVGLALGAGIVISSLIVAALAGKIHPYEVPPEYRNFGLSPEQQSGSAFCCL